MRAASNWRWILGYIAFFPLVGAPWIYVGLHFLLKVPNASILAPLAVFSTLHLASAPLIFWGHLRALRNDADRRMLTISACSYAFCGAMLLIYYAGHFGEISRETEHGATISLPCIALVWSISNYVKSKRAMKQRDRLEQHSL